MAKFRLVRRSGIDMLHRWPATERCNLDDTDRDTALEIESDQAWKLVRDHTVDACQYCFPLPGEE